MRSESSVRCDLIAVPTVGTAFLVTLECGHVWVSDASVYRWLLLPCPQCAPGVDGFYSNRHVVGCARRVQITNPWMDELTGRPLVP